MPTYDYRCDACGETFERFQSIMAAPVKVCPKCRKAKVRRLVSAGAGLIFRGSGFYITDYRSEAYKTAAKNESGGTKSEGGGGTSEAAGGKSEGGVAGASSAAAPGAASKSESKPASKPAAKK
jgi:putative FmdB family regulatory protein